MRQIIVGIFTQRVCAEATLRRLELRGFRAECVGAPATEDAPQAPRARGRLKERWLWLDEAIRWSWPWSRAPRQGELLVRVHVGSALEAQAAREILRASGASEASPRWEGWANWNW
jgi:hypothetical protein